MNQEYKDTVTNHLDKGAIFQDLGDYKRIHYVDQDKTNVTLDISNDELGIKRTGPWTTLGLFSLSGESKLEVYSQEGVLVFDPIIKKLDVKSDFVELIYDLEQNGEYIDTYRYYITWQEGG